MVNYKITNVDFSYRTGINTGEGEVTHERATYLLAHVIYEYQGLYNSTEYGTAVVNLGLICSSVFDPDSLCVSLEEGTLPSYENIMDTITGYVEAKIASDLRVAQENSYIKTFLADINKLKDSQGNPWPSRYTEAPKSYDELDEWNTGIGSVGYNKVPEGQIIES